MFAAAAIRARSLCLVLAIGLVVAACGGSDSSADTTSTVATTAATTATSLAVTTTVPTTTTALATTTTEAPAFTETSDLVYRTINGYDLLMDVYTPAGEGPWPVVVAFHGLDSLGKDEADTEIVAEAAAAEGMLVFAPSWIVWDPGPFPITVEVFESWKQTASCSLAYAQEIAPTLGGDPSTTVAYGFSAGIGPTLFASVEPIGGAIAGCSTDAASTPVKGVVLGDGDLFLHTENFDGVYETDPETMQAEAARLSDPSLWPGDLDAEFIVWVSGNGTNTRPIGDPAEGWFAQRDPDGMIRAELEELGQFEDGTFSAIDAGELFELRLTRAGIDVTLDEYSGGHTTSNKVAELVGYLVSLTGS